MKEKGYVRLRPFKNLTDYDLVMQIQQAKSGKDLQLSQTELYYRYAAYLYKCAYTELKNVPGSEALCKDLVQRTFIIAFKKIKGFIFKETTNNDYHYQVKAWLGRTAKYVYLQMVDEKEVHFHAELSGFEEQIIDPATVFIADIDESITKPISERLRLTREALTKLNDKQRDVLEVYASEDCVATGKHISNESMAYLCNKYQTTADNIRQIKKRALDKVKQQLSI